MPENKFDSEHAIIPVHHAGSDAVHNIAIPPDTDLGDLHNALTDAGYAHDQLPIKRTGPTREGTLEMQPEFRQSMEKLWNEAGNGKVRGEVGFTADASGKPGPFTKTNLTNEGTARMEMPDGAYIVHSHPDAANARFSPQDIESSRTHPDSTVYLISRDGLFSAHRGEVTQVYSTPGEAYSEKKEPKKWVPKYRTDPKTGQQIRIN